MARRVASSCIWLATCWCMAVIGCSSSKDLSEGKQAASMSELQARLRDRAEKTQPIVGPMSRPDGMVVEITLVELLLDAQTETAWSLVRTGSGPATDIQEWRANGLRFGCLSTAQMKQFLDLLVNVRRLELRRMLSTHELNPMQITPRLTEPVTVKLASGKQILHRTFNGGRFRFLFRLLDEGGIKSLALVPQHYIQQPRLMPPMPGEDLLDGQVFDELATQIPLRENDVVALSVTTPGDHAESQPSNAGDAAITLGQALLTSGSDKSARQYIVLLTARPYRR